MYFQSCMQCVCACKHVPVLTSLTSYYPQCLHVRLKVTPDFDVAGKHYLHVDRPTLTLSCIVCHPVCAGHVCDIDLVIIFDL